MAVAGLVFGNAAMATAIPADIDIDFRVAAWSGAQFQGPSYSADGITATAMGGWERLWQSNDDGLGIWGGENDEINGAEILGLPCMPIFTTPTGS